MLTKALLLAVLSIESGGNPNAVSPTGAQGLLQLTSIGAKEVCQQYGCDPGFDLMDPETNMRMGIQLLEFYLKEAKGDPIAMVVLYNSGYVGYYKYLRGEPLSEETTAYVKKFKQLRRNYVTLFYRIPEELPANYEHVAPFDLDGDLFLPSLLIGPANAGVGR